MTSHTLTAAAYELDDGGFRGVVVDRRNKERLASDVLPTIEAARFWARQRVHKIMGETPWLPGYIYRPYWIMNVWTN